MCQGSGNWVTLTDQPAEERARVPTEQLKESNVGLKLTGGTDTELLIILLSILIKMLIILYIQAHG